MKYRLPFIILMMAANNLVGQSASTVADSLAYENVQVSAYKNGVLYRSYRTGFAYPRTARDKEIEGVMSFVCYLDETCNVAKVEYTDSLGPDFEESIETGLTQITKIYKAYKYQNCEKIVFTQELNFKVN